mmetsp:Transcript_58611/g.156912  ORF Transcript_58611/g.156912 Transcript_58611/m.156912 type:complete len:203 (-) Transcript_58611:334-942(-)
MQEQTRRADEVAEEDRVRCEDAPPLAVQVDPPAHEEVPGEHVRPLLRDKARTPHEVHHGGLRAEVGKEVETDAWVEHLRELGEVRQVVVIDRGHVDDDEYVHEAEEERRPERLHDLPRHRPVRREDHDEPKVLRQEGDNVECNTHHGRCRRDACQQQGLRQRPARRPASPPLGAAAGAEALCPVACSSLRKGGPVQRHAMQG